MSPKMFSHVWINSGYMNGVVQTGCKLCDPRSRIEPLPFDLLWCQCFPIGYIDCWLVQKSLGNASAHYLSPCPIARLVVSLIGLCFPLTRIDILGFPVCSAVRRCIGHRCCGAAVALTAGHWSSSNHTKMCD